MIKIEGIAIRTMKCIGIRYESGFRINHQRAF